MIKAVRHDMAAMLGISNQKRLSAASLDLMRPVERFAELEGRARRYNLNRRFEAEFQELKALLNDLHRDASRLRRFLEVRFDTQQPVARRVGNVHHVTGPSAVLDK